MKCMHPGASKRERERERDQTRGNGGPGPGSARTLTPDGRKEESERDREEEIDSHIGKFVGPFHVGYVPQPERLPRVRCWELLVPCRWHFLNDSHPAGVFIERLWGCWKAPIL